MKNYAPGIIRANPFARVDEAGATLELSLLEFDWFAGLIKEKPEVLRHEVLSDAEIVITAPTKELQEFITEHADNPEAWIPLAEDPLIRREPQPSETRP